MTTEIERLKTLYAVIFGVPAEKIDMRGWRASCGGLSTDRRLLNMNCGTTGCAIGLACAYPPFIAEGFSWDMKDCWPVYRVHGIDDPRMKYVHFHAVEKFFDLADFEAMHIFVSSYSGLPAKRQVLRKIRAHLLRKGAITIDRSHQLAERELALTD